MSIFKTYDIRGKYPKEINEEIVKKISLSLIRYFKRKKLKFSPILISYDCRESSPNLFKGLLEGLSLTSEKITLLDGGLCSTPFFYYLNIKLKANLGIMITASHNPPEFNGFKIIREKAIPVADEELKLIEKIFKKIKTPKRAGRKIKIKKVSKKFLNQYLDFLIKKSNLKREKIKKFKIGIDCGNGMIGPEIEKLVKKLKLKAEILYQNLDGRFPNHLADPLDEKTLKNLKKLVKEKKLDFGISFDGDGDRVIFIDEKGETIRGDFILSLLAKDYLKKKPGSCIIYEHRASLVVKETIEKNKGIPLISRTGHSLIKALMRKKDALLAGEISGHYFYKELGFVDNALFTFLKILEILAKENKPFSEIIRPFKKYYQSGEINFKLGKNEKFKILKEVEKFFSKKSRKILKIDGVSIYFDNWWFNLRPSNTENLLRLNIEAKKKKILEEKKREIFSLLKKLGEVPSK